jgi:hypothetical protein
MQQKINPLLIVGGGIAAYLLYEQYIKGQTPAVTAPAVTTFNPVVPVTNAETQSVTAAEAGTTQVYGVNSGVKGGNGSFYTCANYDQLLALNPNLGNPNYVMTQAEANTYLSNYLDLQQALPTWVGQDTYGFHVNTIYDAVTLHWKDYGCAEKRIFYPLVPPSNNNYIPPPPKAASTSIWGTIAKVATIAAGGILTVASAGTAAPLIAAGTSAALTAESAIHGPDIAQLSDMDLQTIVTGGYILKKILPFYLESSPDVVNSIINQLDALLLQIGNG